MHRPARPALSQEVAEVLPEEDGRPPIRKDEAGIFQSGRQVVGGDLFQKWCHAAKIYAPNAKLLHKQRKFLPKIHIPRVLFKAMLEVEWKLHIFVIRIVQNYK